MPPLIFAGSSSLVILQILPPIDAQNLYLVTKLVQCPNATQENEKQIRYEHSDESAAASTAAVGMNPPNCPRNPQNHDQY